MSIAPVTGIKVPVSFMANKKQAANKETAVDKFEKTKIPDVSDKVKQVGDEVNETVIEAGDALKDITGSVAGAGATFYGAKCAVSKFATNLFKTFEKDASGNKIVNFDQTPKDLIEETEEAGKIVKKLKDNLTDDQKKNVVYKMKNSKVKIGVAIGAAIIVVGLAIKGYMDKKKAEAAEAEAEAAEEAAEEVEEAAEETTEETTETEEASEKE